MCKKWKHHFLTRVYMMGKLTQRLLFTYMLLKTWNTKSITSNNNKCVSAKNGLKLICDQNTLILKTKFYCNSIFKSVSTHNLKLKVLKWINAHQNLIETHSQKILFYGTKIISVYKGDILIFFPFAVYCIPVNMI